MPAIEILEQEETEEGWKMKVRVDDLEFEVTLDKTYWQTLTDGKEEPAELIQRSFRFLLEREPKESILRRFNLKDIERYFPEYPKIIKQ